ncbi:MAG: hypothetical protein KC561_20315, partial [Myxococcales bacterium]|nr:hypothetical protein [Myxococcales bacterium]
PEGGMITVFAEFVTGDEFFQEDGRVAYTVANLSPGNHIVIGDSYFFESEEPGSTAIVSYNDPPSEPFLLLGSNGCQTRSDEVFNNNWTTNFGSQCIADDDTFNIILYAEYTEGLPQTIGRGSIALQGQSTAVNLTTQSWVETGYFNVDVTNGSGLDARINQIANNGIFMGDDSMFLEGPDGSMSVIALGNEVIDRSIFTLTRSGENEVGYSRLVYAMPLPGVSSDVTVDADTEMLPEITDLSADATDPKRPVLTWTLDSAFPGTVNGIIIEQQYNESDEGGARFLTRGMVFSPGAGSSVTFPELPDAYSDWLPGDAGFSNYTMTAFGGSDIDTWQDVLANLFSKKIVDEYRGVEVWISDFYGYPNQQGPL